MACAGCEVVNNDIGLLGDGALFGDGAANVEQQKLGDSVPVWTTQHQHPHAAFGLGKSYLSSMSADSLSLSASNRVPLV